MKAQEKTGLNAQAAPAAPQMSALEAVFTRRSVAAVQPDVPVPAALVDLLLQAAACAPQHKRTAPWRFCCFAGEGRAKLQTAMEEGQAARGKSAETMVGKAYRAPLIIAVWCAPGRTAAALPVWEEEAAVAAAIQNMLLVAHAHGLGAIWRSGAPCEMPQVHACLQDRGGARFDATKGDRMMGFVYVGVPL